MYSLKRNWFTVAQTIGGCFSLCRFRDRAVVSRDFGFPRRLQKVEHKRRGKAGRRGTKEETKRERNKERKRTNSEKTQEKKEKETEGERLIKVSKKGKEKEIKKEM